MGGRSRPFCNSSNSGSLNSEDCFELHDSDFALFSGVCTFLLKRRDSDIMPQRLCHDGSSGRFPTNRVDDRPSERHVLPW